MSGASSGVPGRVSLPWAQGIWDRDAYVDRTQAPVAQQPGQQAHQYAEMQRELLNKVSQGPIGVLTENPQAEPRGTVDETAGGGATGRQRSGLPDEALPATRRRAGGTMYRPEPVVPVEDRLEARAEDFVSMAVALDVLSTMTRRVGSQGTVLHQLTLALARVGELCGLDERGLLRLLCFAESSAGTLRAQLSRSLAASTRSLDEPLVSDTTDIPSSTPATVAHAMRRIERATTLVLREAQLVLEGRREGQRVGRRQ